MHILTAGIRCRNAPRLRAGVPVVDGAVVLDARIRALPGRLRDAPEQLLGVDGVDDLARHAGTQPESVARLDRAHELVRDAHRVVRVLVLHRGDVRAAEVHVEPGVPQYPDLGLLLGLGRDELLAVRVVHVEDDHLGRAPGGATGLDGAGAGVRTAHERHRARR